MYFPRILGVFVWLFVFGFNTYVKFIGYDPPKIERAEREKEER